MGFVLSVSYLCPIFVLFLVLFVVRLKRRYDAQTLAGTSLSLQNILVERKHC
jgi:hypothetical protein